MSLATGDVMTRSSSALQFNARNKLSRSRVFSLFDTHTRTRLACTPSEDDDDRLLFGFKSSEDGECDDDVTAAKSISPRIQNSSLCWYKGSSGFRFNSNGTSFGQNPSNSRLSSTAKP